MLALLGVLSAINAALRWLGAGRPASSRVLPAGARRPGVRPGFGFALGSLSLFASALLTAGVGRGCPSRCSSPPAGMGAGYCRVASGAVPSSRCWRRTAWSRGLRLRPVDEPVGLAAPKLGVVPGHAGSLAFVPGDPLLENLRRFGVYTPLTSTGSDTGRAITTALAVVVLGPAVLGTLRRASRRAVWLPATARVVGPPDPHRQTTGLSS
ncbi:MAG: ECF transporter S component [Nocardioides sp.]